jgi:hypothetical protein
VFLLLLLLDRADRPDRAVARLREFGVPDPLIVRARSVEAALSTEVPVFAGLRSLALGADDDRLILFSILPAATSDEVQRLVNRIQLEMDADDPPMGKLIAVPVFSAKI